MTDTEHARAEAQDWPLRPWLLAGLLGLAGLLIHLASDGHHNDPLRVALAAFLFFTPIAAALSAEEADWKRPALFAGVLGLVMAGLAWRAVQYGEYLPDEQYGFAAGVVASLLALPLFQAGFLKHRFATPYADAHYHVWNDAIAGAGAVAFTGLSWVVLAILSELFLLLKIDLLRDLMNDEWFGWTFSGVAFGAALGTLKNQARVLGTLQGVVMLVFSLLAVPLAVGLALFLLATAISGPDVLWQATRSATPVLLACAVGAFGLTNAVIRNADTAMSGNRVMRGAAFVLALVILPLAVFAAASMGLRLNQYGLAPERLWGLVAIAVACAFGLAYWVALVRGRWSGWAERVRHANLHLAAGVCVVAIVLALPVFDFGAVSTRNQIARLDSGKVSADRFDYAALRWDFGEPGRKALARLEKRKGKVGELARAAQLQDTRPYRLPEGRQLRTAADFNLRVQPANAALEQAVRRHLAQNQWDCEKQCVALDLGPAAGAVAGGALRSVALVQDGSVQTLTLPLAAPGGAQPLVATPARPQVKLGPNSKVELREVTRRQVFIDGQPVGQVLD